MCHLAIGLLLWESLFISLFKGFSFLKHHVEPYPHSIGLKIFSYLWRESSCKPRDNNWYSLTFGLLLHCLLLLFFVFSSCFFFKELVNALNHSFVFINFINELYLFSWISYLPVYSIATAWLCVYIYIFLSFAALNSLYRGSHALGAMPL